MWAVIFFANWYYYNWFVCLLIFLLNVRCNIREVSLFHVLVLRHLQFLFFFLSFCFLSGSHQFKPNYTTDLFLYPLKKENQICVSGAIEWEQIYVQIKGLKKKRKKMDSWPFCRILLLSVISIFAWVFIVFLWRLYKDKFSMNYH